MFTRDCDHGEYMIKISHPNDKLIIYLDRDGAEKYKRYFGNTRVSIQVENRQLSLIPKVDGDYVFYTLPYGGMKIVSVSKTNRFNLPTFGSIALEAEFRQDCIVVQLPEHLPEYTKRAQRKPKAKKAKQFKHTSEDVVRDLQSLPINREHQEVPLEAETIRDVRLIVLYEGQQYHLQPTSDQLLTMTLSMLDQKTA